ncbi:MAG TPA: VTT domain-containing protein [Verrucomicrobiae bacterium]|nr:VTT domain-containing protein [Verrucomicrobiae bacterium]
MPAKNQLLLKYSAMVAALKALGAWGVLITATLDSCAFGIPMDPLVASYVYASPGRAWLYCLMGALGGAIGSLIPYALGRAGGELFLLKRIDEARLTRLRDRFERQEFLALMVPAMLPPPTPFKLFVFAAGVFEMKVPQFLLAIFIGRLLRFGILALLTVIFGPQIVTETKELIKHHPVLLALIAIVILVLGYVAFRLMQSPREVAAEIGSNGPKSEESPGSL